MLPVTYEKWCLHVKVVIDSQNLWEVTDKKHAKPDNEINST